MHKYRYLMDWPYIWEGFEEGSHDFDHYSVLEDDQPLRQHAKELHYDRVTMELAGALPSEVWG